MLVLTKVGYQLKFVCFGNSDVTKSFFNDHGRTHRELSLSKKEEVSMIDSCMNQGLLIMENAD